MSVTLNTYQERIAKGLLKSEARVKIAQLASELDLDQSLVSATMTIWSQQGWIDLEDRPRDQLEPASDVTALLDEGLPERRALSLIQQRGGHMPVSDMAKAAKDLGLPMNEIIRWGTARGWLQRDKGDLVITESGAAHLEEPDDDEKALRWAAAHDGPWFLDQGRDQGLDVERVKTLLKNRAALARIKTRTDKWVALTTEGRQTLSQAQVVVEKNNLSPEDIASGQWRQIQLRSYDVCLPARTEYPAKQHPMRRVLEEVRRAFLQMGFREVVSPMVDTAFWDFDALFQPQDHPARDMQDTFYVKRPGQGRLPAADMVDRIRKTHEDGWETGSTGWGYRWDEERSRELVLRTHTTATTIRTLAGHPNPPLKVFCVGKVFRNETVSYKHLPEFFQVDGIVIDREASLATLLGTLKAFYRKMGFDRVKFKPGFFPYTEPSAEAFIWMESKQKWMEMGGSGIFRPEVTRPFGCQYPVLAWGLGLDRLAMMRYGIDDIRDLYWADLERMQEVELCR